MRILSRGVALLILILPVRIEAARLSVVVNGFKSRNQKIIAVLKRDFGTKNQIKIYNLQDYNLSDPIVKGRFLADVANADIIVPVGETATRLTAQELDDLKTFFISAAGLSGEYLGQPEVSGILSYSPEETARVAKTLLPELKVMGALYTPGYEGVVAKLSVAAKRRNIVLNSYLVKSLKEIGPVTREMVAKSDLFWVVGDPLLTQDFIFSYLLQESLLLKKPMATPVLSLVSRGALFSTIPDEEALSQQISTSLAEIIAPKPGSAAAERIQSAPEGGLVMINHSLAEKWHIQIPSSLRLWRENTP